MDGHSLVPYVSSSSRSEFSRLYFQNCNSSFLPLDVARDIPSLYLGDSNLKSMRRIVRASIRRHIKAAAYQKFNGENRGEAQRDAHASIPLFTRVIKIPFLPGRRGSSSSDDIYSRELTRVVTTLFTRIPRANTLFFSRRVRDSRLREDEEALHRDDDSWNWQVASRGDVSADVIRV